MFVGGFASEFHVKRSLAHGKVCPALLLCACCQQYSSEVPPSTGEDGVLGLSAGVLNDTIISTKVFVGNKSLLYGAASHMWFLGVILDLSGQVIVWTIHFPVQLGFLGCVLGILVLLKCPASSSSW